MICKISVSSRYHKIAGAYLLCLYHGRIQSRVKHLRWNFVKTGKGFYPLTIFAKSSMLDIWQDSTKAIV